MRWSIVRVCLGGELARGKQNPDSAVMAPVQTEPQCSMCKNKSLLCRTLRNTVGCGVTLSVTTGHSTRLPSWKSLPASLFFVLVSWWLFQRNNYPKNGFCLSFIFGPALCLLISPGRPVRIWSFSCRTDPSEAAAVKMFSSTFVEICSFISFF